MTGAPLASDSVFDGHFHKIWYTSQTFWNHFQVVGFSFDWLRWIRKVKLFLVLIKTFPGCLLNRFGGVYPLGFSDSEFVPKFVEIRKFCLLEKRHFFFRPFKAGGQPNFNLVFTDVDWAHPRLLDRKMCFFIFLYLFQSWRNWEFSWLFKRLLKSITFGVGFPSVFWTTESICEKFWATFSMLIPG